MSKHNQHYQNTLAFVNLIVINNNSRQTKFKVWKSFHSFPTVLCDHFRAKKAIFESVHELEFQSFFIFTFTLN